MVLRSCTKPPWDLITTHFRGNLKLLDLIASHFSHQKISQTYSPANAQKFHESKLLKKVRPYIDPLSRPKKVRPYSDASPCKSYIINPKFDLKIYDFLRSSPWILVYYFLFQQMVDNRALNLLNFKYVTIFTVTFWTYLVHHPQPPFGCPRQFSPFSNFRSNKPNLGLWQKSSPNNEEAIEGLEQAGSKRLRTLSQKYPRSLGLCDFGDHKSPEHCIVQRASLNSSGSYTSDSENLWTRILMCQYIL